jgi:hypothetical protein
MTASFTLSIDSLSLPVGGEAEAAMVAQSMTATLEELHARDMASGIVWREVLDKVSLEVRDGLGAQETGQALANHLRDRLAILEDAR